MTNLLDHLRPVTLANLIAELIEDHAEEAFDGEYIFLTDDARAAYNDLLQAGIRNCGETEFFRLLDVAVN